MGEEQRKAASVRRKGGHIVDDVILHGEVECERPRKVLLLRQVQRLSRPKTACDEILMVSEIFG